MNTCPVHKNIVLTFILITWILITPDLANSQAVHNRVNASAGYHAGFFLGHDYFANGSQSLYVYMRNYQGYSFQGQYNLNRTISLGVNCSAGFASNEMNTGGVAQTVLDLSLYRGSDLSIYSLKTYFQLSSNSLFSRTSGIRVFLNAGPAFGVSSLELGIPSSNEWTGYPEKSSDFYYGLAGRVGVEWIILPSFGLNLYYSTKYCLVNSILYQDKHIFTSQIGAGIVFYFAKEKLLKY